MCVTMAALVMSTIEQGLHCAFCALLSLAWLSLPSLRSYLDTRKLGGLLPEQRWTVWKLRQSAQTLDLHLQLGKSVSQSGAGVVIPASTHFRRSLGSVAA